jgi:hypothetical protein
MLYGERRAHLQLLDRVEVPVVCDAVATLLWCCCGAVVVLCGAVWCCVVLCGPVWCCCSAVIVLCGAGSVSRDAEGREQRAESRETHFWSVAAILLKCSSVLPVVQWMAYKGHAV